MTLSTCEKGTCRLQRNTSAKIEIKFTPEKDLKTLETSVYAIVAEIPLPFIGVDGTSACDNLFKADGKTKASCPLKAGEEYIYRNEFPILEIYPKLTLKVRWALKSNSEDIVCFLAPARIV